MEKEYSFDDVVLFARTGLNPRQNFKLGKGNNVYITIKNIQNNSLVIDKNTDYIDDAAIEKIHKRSQIKKGDVLFASIGRIGDMYIISDDPIGWDINESVFAFTLNTKIIRQKYFYYYFKNPAVMDYIMRNSSGSTFKSIKMNQLKRMTFLLPDLNEQDNIISELDNAASIIQNHIVLQEKLDNLIKSRFVEMFGDSVVNLRKLPVLSWNDVFYTTTGKLDSNAMKEDGQYPFFTCAKENYWIDTYAFDCEALLLAGNNAMGIYDVKHYKGKFNAYQRTYVLRLLNEKWSYKLFKQQLEDKLLYLQNHSKGTNTRYLTLGILNNLHFVVPPIEQQAQYDVFVQQVDKLKIIA